MKPTPDELLQALAEEARADAEGLDDVQLQAVIRGSASRAERRALEEEARRAGIDEAALAAALRPIGADTMARVQATAARELVGGQATTSAKSGGEGGGRGGGGDGGDATVIAMPRRWTVIVGGLALAAALALFVVTRGGGEVQVASLPSYELTVSGGRAVERGAEEKVTLVPGARVVLSLRPATPVQGPIDVRGFLVRGEHTVPLQTKATLTAEGAVRLEGKLGDLGPEWLGEVEVVASIARPGTTHEPLDAEVPGRQLVRAPVVVAAREGR